MAEGITRYGGQSATAPLRDVLVKRPGPAFGAAYDDPAVGFLHPVDLEVAQREHDAFTDLLTKLGVRVHHGPAVDPHDRGPGRGVIRPSAATCWPPGQASW